MGQYIAPPRLGQNILVVVDNTPVFLSALKVATSSLPGVTEKFFTLIHCCPPLYWEHGGADNPEVQSEIEQVWETEEAEFAQTEDFLEQARAVFLNAGVPESHVDVKIPTDDESLLESTMTELKQGSYTGVIVTSYHQEIINRLLKRGVTDVLRQIPNVAVWAIDTKDIEKT